MIGFPRAVLAGLLLAVYSTAARADAVTSQRLERHITVDGIDRRYIAYVPDGASQRGPMPVVLAFHGGIEGADLFDDLAHIETARLASNFIIVYPDGYKRTFNEGGTCCGPAMEEKIDDVKFVRTLLSDIDSVAHIDRHRIYATGYSNGGGMSYYLACVMSDQIAAIAPVSSGMRVQMRSDCHPSHSIPVLEWHGLLDHYSPYDGGMSAAKDTAPIPPVQDTIAFWKSLDGTQSVTHTKMFDGAVECDIYAGGRDGSIVEQCRIPKMGHRWPGAQPTARTTQGDDFMRRYLGDLGPYSPPMDANDAILEFFNRDKTP
jgi:polyhydroxybutyrate depolymerase